MQFQDFTFGVEIECYVPGNATRLFAALQAAGLSMSHVAGSIHATTSGWKVVPDGSLHSAPAGHVGVEVVSPILRGDEGLAQVVRAMDAIKAFGGKVNTTCGLHVHVGAQSATATQLKNLAKMFLKYEHHLDSLCPPTRRGNANRYCQSNRQQAAGYGVAATYEAQIAAAFGKLDGLRSASAIATVINGGWNRGNRYYKLNYQSLSSHGTVEFRQHAGTVEGQKASAWIKLMVGLVASSFSLKSVTTQREPSFDKLVRKVDRATADYLKARRVALNRGGALAD
jgi:hypothetical protein